MKFEEALAAMRKGKKVRRTSWGKGGYWHISGPQIMWCGQEAAATHPDFTPLADDWEIVEELHTFDEALAWVRSDALNFARRKGWNKSDRSLGDDGLASYADMLQDDWILL